ncbi:Maf1 regulator [Schizopora paradoxa]|uniref:Maf1 regulator n=1 Tax=Schizopora paradoxa TaxID=27342 RepID=A0A0H2RK88_9AGAM|nr:Maf1 regulator [Schizopora paradoxa]
MKYIEFPELARLSQALTHEGPECSVHTRIEAYSCKNISRDKKLFRALEHAYAEDAAAHPHFHHNHSSSPSSSSLIDKDKGDNTNNIRHHDADAEPTPFGPMDKHASRKTLYLLIATLNVAFPDHEFSDVRPAAFCKEESGASVLHSLSTTLVAPHRPGVRAPRTYSSYPPPAELVLPASVPTSSSPPAMMRASPYAPTPLVAGTHPTLFRILDDTIGLADCEVYSYVPDLASDPYAADYSDGEDDIGSGEDDSTESDEETFAFDDYDVDETESRPSRSSWRSQYEKRTTRFGTPRRTSSDTDEGSPLRVRLKRHGSLLWSSHWFFLNRKMKRILFISICAQTKGGHQWTSDEDDLSWSQSSSSTTHERFHGWEGAAGAGARAVGLKPRSV